MPRRDPPVKLYYRIGEVAQVVGVQPHVLRYWESEFGSIRPQKSARGQRVYSHKDLEKLLRVKKLLHSEGYTIAGAKKKMREPAQADDPGTTPAASPVVAAEPLRVAPPVPIRAPSAPLPSAVERVPEHLRIQLQEIRAQIEAELAELDREPEDTTLFPDEDSTQD